MISHAWNKCGIIDDLSITTIIVPLKSKEEGCEKRQIGREVKVESDSHVDTLNNILFSLDPETKKKKKEPE